MMQQIMEPLLANPRALIGLVGGVILMLGLFIMDKKENKKLFRHKKEYGSARWGTKKDIEPFMDENFKNNIILTQTEALTMSSRVKNPANARNKNCLIVGGSGSGKTRFWIKPNLLQLHSSYVLTDPNGKVFIR